MLFYFKKYKFSPKWYFVIGTVFLTALFIQLGCWQLERAATKIQLQNIFTERLRLPPRQLLELPKEDDIRYYPVQVKGHYDNAHNILLDNKVHAHRVGYEVLTPFILNGSKQQILLNRGWIPADINRSKLPVIPAVMGEQTLVGYVYLTPGQSFTLGRVLENEAWPLRIQALDITALQDKLKQSLYPFVLLLPADPQDNLVRDWRPIAMSADKHKGYAMQWFAFAGILVMLFFVLSIHKNK